MKERHFLVLVVLGFILVGIVPLVLMFVDSFRTVDGFSIKVYHTLFDPSLLKSLEHSVWLAFSVACLTTLVGVGLGFLFAKTDFFAGKFFALIFTFPLLIPPYIFAFSWFELLGHHPMLFGFWGSLGVLFSIYLPIPLLFTMLFIRQINPRLEEASRLVCGWKGTVRYITLGLLLPAISFSFLLVFILAFGEFSVPNFLRYDVFSTVSFTQFSAFYDFKAATASTVPLLLVVLLVLIFEYAWVERKQFTFKESYRVEKIALGSYHGWMLLLVFILLLLIMIVPLGHLILQVGSWEYLMQAVQKAWNPLWHTLFFAFFAASALVVFGFLLGYLVNYRLFSWWRFVDMGVMFLFALPATVFGISLILFWNRPWSDFVYATPLIVLLALVGKYLALTMKVTQIKLRQIPNSFVEVAALLGASWHQRWRYILLPMLKETLMIAWLVGFIFSLRESTLTMLLYPAGWETLPVYIFTQMANGDPHIIAGLSLIMIVVMVLALGFLVWFLRGRLS